MNSTREEPNCSNNPLNFFQIPSYIISTSPITREMVWSCSKESD